MKPTQALLILCNDAADLKKIAAGMRGIPGVNTVRTGCFRQEHVSERQVAMFFPTVPSTQTPGIEVARESDLL
jgi:hypothetical protein